MQNSSAIHGFETISRVQRMLSGMMRPWVSRWTPSPSCESVRAINSIEVAGRRDIRRISWKWLERVYQNPRSAPRFEQLAILRSPIGVALRNRRRCIVNALSRSILRLSVHGEVRVLGIGSGPGSHLLDALLQSGVCTDAVSAVMLDTDESALEHGRGQARQRGLQNQIRFVHGDAREMPADLRAQRYHVVKLVGLPELLSDAEILSLCDSIRNLMYLNGSLVTHGFVDACSNMPIFKRVYGMTPKQRCVESMSALLSTAGFVNQSSTEVPTSTWPVIVARPAWTTMSMPVLRRAA